MRKLTYMLKINPTVVINDAAEAHGATWNPTEPLKIITFGA